MDAITYPCPNTDAGEVSLCLQNGPMVASFTEEVNPRLAKRPLKTNGRLVNHGLTSLVKEATAVNPAACNWMAWQWAETLVEIRGTLADIRVTAK